MRAIVAPLAGRRTVRLGRVAGRPPAMRRARMPLTIWEGAAALPGRSRVPMATTKLTSRGQVTIPKDVRERLGLRPGDEIVFVEDQESVRLEKRRGPSGFAKYRGYLKDLAGQDPDLLL